jgi:hypothetical protein
MYAYVTLGSLICWSVLITPESYGKMVLEIGIGSINVLQWLHARVGRVIILDMLLRLRMSLNFLWFRLSWSSFISSTKITSFTFSEALSRQIFNFFKHLSCSVVVYTQYILLSITSNQSISGRRNLRSNRRFGLK